MKPTTLVPVLLFLLLLSSCENKENKHDRRVGRFVTIRISGQRGQIVRWEFIRRKPMYAVRYVSTVRKEETNGLVSQSKSAYPANSYNIDWFLPMELDFNDSQ